MVVYIVVTAYDSESGRPGSNPEWGQYTMRLRSLHRAYPSLHPSGVVQSCPRVGWTRGSGRVGSRFCRILAGRVGSGQHFGFFSFLLIISWYLNQYEFSNTTFGLIDFLRYLIYNN